MNCQPRHTPTPAEIKAECEAIRATWDELTLRQRLVMKPERLEVRRVRAAVREPVEE